MYQRSNSYPLFVLNRFVITFFFIVFTVIPLQSNGDSSASDTAENISAEQRMLSGVTGTAAGVASVKAMAACSGKPSPSCPYLTALAAGLFGATYLLISESGANQDLAAQYQGNCIIKGPAYQWRGTESHGVCVSLAEECTQLGGTWAPIQNRCLLPEEACINVGRKWNRQKQECEAPEDPSDPNSETKMAANNKNNDCPEGKIKIAGRCKTPTSKECAENGGVMFNKQCVKETVGGGGGLKDKLDDFLAKRGIAWDPKKQQITLPNGMTGSAKDMNKALKNLPPEQLQPFTQALSAAAAKLSKKNNSLGLDDESKTESASGGGGSGKSSKSFKGYAGSGYGRGSSGFGNANMLAQRQNKKNSQLNKMTVRAGNDQVGISQNNIFQMVHARYQSKRQNKEFIK